MHNKPYEELKKIVRERNIKNLAEYQKVYKTIEDAPHRPDRLYKRMGTWIGWYDFFGTVRQGEVVRGVFIPKNKYISYKKLKKNVRELQIESACHYHSVCHTIPKAPYDPYKVYSEWKNWHVFLHKKEKEKKSKTPKSKVVTLKKETLSINKFNFTIYVLIYEGRVIKKSSSISVLKRWMKERNFVLNRG